MFNVTKNILNTKSVQTIHNLTSTYKLARLGPYWSLNFMYPDAYMQSMYTDCFGAKFYTSGLYSSPVSPVSAYLSSYVTGYMAG